MKIYKQIDDMMSSRDKLPGSIALAVFRKAKVVGNRFIGPMPADYIRPVAPKLSKEYRRLDAKIKTSFSKIKNISKQ